MPTIHLVSPSLADVAELLSFEKRNRVFFESNINARSKDYYSNEGVLKAIEIAEEDARNGTAFQYLVRDESGQLVARVNLSRLRREHFHSAELGYRVAEAAAGKGIATEAVRQVLQLAFGVHRLMRVEAVARPENLGSVKVLLRNGFTQFGCAKRSFQLRGVWYDRLYFERHASAVEIAS